MVNALQLVTVLRDHQRFFHPVVAFEPLTDKLVSFDFTAANKELTDEMLKDTAIFTSYIESLLKRSAARYGIGGYAELRTVYAASRVFDADEPDGEPRRLHLGTDIWGKPHTAVTAPADGIIHSYAFNNRFGDYGTTIILSHNLSGTSFYTLYGHLSLNSIKNIREGERISAGDVFGEFGIPAENGQWPPHLHFQVISEIGDRKGDYPGVCALSQRQLYLDNCPDPDLILQLNQYLR